MTVHVWDDHGFSSSISSSLMVGAGNHAANGSVTLTAPPNTSSGSVVTLVIEVYSPRISDSNYVILRLSIISWDRQTEPLWVIFLVCFIVTTILICVTLFKNFPSRSCQGYYNLGDNCRHLMSTSDCGYSTIMICVLITFSVLFLFCMFLYR